MDEKFIFGEIVSFTIFILSDHTSIVVFFKQVEIVLFHSIRAEEFIVIQVRVHHVYQRFQSFKIVQALHVQLPHKTIFI